MSELTIHRGHRFALKPTEAQDQALSEWAGVTRLVYNLCLEQRRDFWRQYRRLEGRPLTWVHQCREITTLRAEYGWIAVVCRNSLDQAVLDLDRAFAEFFAGRARFPTPRRKGENDSFRLRPTDVAVRRLNAKWSEVRISKIGWVKFRDTRPMRGRLINATISMKASEWFVSFAREIEHEEPMPLPASVGIDRGIVRTLTLSTGEHIQAPDQTRVIAARKRAQRALVRCKRGSGRRKVAKARVAALSARTARIRSDWCHRASTDIARRFGLVAIEDLKIKNMTASAAGTIEEPGRNVRQKAGLNRSILEQSWGRFAEFLEYKLTERGGIMISVPPHYSSQTCASCGAVDARSRESQAVFRCVHCDHADNADVNAAKEILRRSTSDLGAEDWRAGLLKRQPQEIAHA